MADRRYTINAFTVKLELPPSDASGGTVHPGAGKDIERPVRELLEFFERLDVHATFFTADDITSAAPGLVKRIAEAGHELAILAPRFLTPLEQLLRLREEISTARARLEDTTGREVFGCRLTPIISGWRSPAMIETLVQEGLIYSSSTHTRQRLAPLLIDGSAKAHKLQTPSGQLWELPLTSWRPLGIGIPSIRTGGGPSMSVLPVWMISRGVDGMNRHGEPAILYVHSWGLAGTAPDYNSLPLKERLLHYGPREELLEKLEAIFHIYRFGSILEAFASRLTTETSRPSSSRRTNIVRLDPTD